MKFELIPTHEHMTYDEKSYIAIKVDLEGDFKVFFYNPAQDIHKEIPNLEIFNESIFEEHFNFHRADIGEYSNKEETGTASGVETNGSDGDYSYKGELIHTYKNKKIEDIPALINNAFTDLDSLQKDAIEQTKENEEYRKDPMGYYGHKPSDFF